MICWKDAPGENSELSERLEVFDMHIKLGSGLPLSYGLI